MPGYKMTRKSFLKTLKKHNGNVISFDYDVIIVSPRGLINQIAKGLK